jgi:predicted NAD/FAD-binding protein|tara:strand:+ start:4329 stop:5585 length:1257 start_codon:yes stop_codon:yes gene_type:complete
MKIAVIGAGISGLTAAYYLKDKHQVTVLESEGRIGGHTATVDVTHEGRDYAIDTGFIVYNDWTYPKFIELLNELGVATDATEMSFSVSCDSSGVEYGGNNLNTMFAQRLNLFKPSFIGMVKDILRFNKAAIEDLDSGRLEETATLGQYLQDNKYGRAFIEHYLVPMGCAIWSASTKTMIDFPLLFFVRFFKNHGLLSVNNRPQWRVVRGGSRSYLKPLIEQLKDSIHVSVDIYRVQRHSGGVKIELKSGEVQEYDHVVFACHSDQAKALLGDISDTEDSVLSAIPYQSNEVVLHTDDTILPRKKLAWSSWNYRLRSGDQSRAVLTYDMNILQGIDSDTTFCVTLNDRVSIDASKILGVYNYSHPVFSLESVAAQSRWGDINGVKRTWFCGAYWGNGFHEDGVASGRRVAQALNYLGDD